MPRTARIDAVEDFHSQSELNIESERERAREINYYTLVFYTRADLNNSPKLTEQEIKAKRLKAESEFARSQKFDSLTVDYSQKQSKKYTQSRCKACDSVVTFCRCSR